MRTATWTAGAGGPEDRSDVGVVGHPAQLKGVVGVDHETTFEWSDFKLGAMDENGDMEIQVTVKNTGSVTGACTSS